MNKQSITKYYRKHRKAIVTATSGLLYGGGWSLGYLTSSPVNSHTICIVNVSKPSPRRARFSGRTTTNSS
ncbi:hypothetical protein SAMN05216277_1357, partial [Halolamina pelagica]